MLKGKTHKFGDDVNTDYIISGKYKFKTLDMDELASHAMEDLDPEFSRKLEKGDFVVAGRNFGCGSSREQAPLVLKHAGVAAVVAESFARIFYRNSINSGLAAVVCDTSGIEDGDLLEIDLEGGLVKDITKGIELECAPMPAAMLKIFAEGGLVPYMRKHKGFHQEFCQGDEE
ncbi:MAG: 3-isopropylmalate dehydratase small subunit [Actinomycetota bacterium]|nr:3-isopropylmalate dehydratase small subunit [Actinomycetota bacterium]